MNVSIRTCQISVGLSLIGFGVLHLLADDFVTGRPPVHETWTTGKNIFAFVTGFILIIGGILVFVNKKASTVVAGIGVMIFVWAGLQNLYLEFTTWDYGAVLVNLNKSLSLAFGFIFMGSTLLQDFEQHSKPALWINKLGKIAPYAIGFFLFAGGIQHFIFVDFVKFLVPNWIPGATFWVYFTGVALAAAGLGLMTGFYREWAALCSGWMIFAWVIILHIPLALSAVDNAMNEWTAVCEALAVSSLLLLHYYFYKITIPYSYTKSATA